MVWFGPPGSKPGFTYLYGSGSFHRQAKKVSNVLLLLYDFYLTDVNVPSKSKNTKNLDEKSRIRIRNSVLRIRGSESVGMPKFLWKRECSGNNIWTATVEIFLGREQKSLDYAWPLHSWPPVYNRKYWHRITHRADKLILYVRSFLVLNSSSRFSFLFRRLTLIIHNQEFYASWKVIIKKLKIIDALKLLNTKIYIFFTYFLVLPNLGEKNG